MDWHGAIDIYCERTTVTFWAEPINALSNLSFVAAALWGAVTARRRAIRIPVVWILIVLAGCIGLGSFLFHTLANGWSALADVLPIWTFVTLFVLVAMRFILGMTPIRIARVGLIVAAAAVVMMIVLAIFDGPGPRTTPDPLNGSGQYAPALLALLISTLVTWRQDHPAAPWIAAATAVFVVSLVARTLDRDLCAAVPLGTHFVWHLLNGLAIAILLQMLIRTGDFVHRRPR